MHLAPVGEPAALHQQEAQEGPDVHLGHLHAGWGTGVAFGPQIAPLLWAVPSMATAHLLRPHAPQVEQEEHAVVIVLERQLQGTRASRERRQPRVIVRVPEVAADAAESSMRASANLGAAVSGVRDKAHDDQAWHGAAHGKGHEAGPHLRSPAWRTMCWERRGRCRHHPPCAHATTTSHLEVDPHAHHAVLAADDVPEREPVVNGVRGGPADARVSSNTWPPCRRTPSTFVCHPHWGTTRTGRRGSSCPGRVCCRTGAQTPCLASRTRHIWPAAPALTMVHTRAKLSASRHTGRSAA